ncbi:MAG TPA: ABC transporter permease subunit [Gemmatimonadales bacterium]|jgi:Cu-processing system permease protein
MSATLKVLKYELEDVRRSRGVLAYGAILLALTEGLLRFGGTDAGAMLSLLSVVLLLVPLVSLIFGTMYLYNARDFTELLLAQPVRRGALFRGLYLGLSLPLVASLVIGIGAPFLWHGALDRESLPAFLGLLGTGVLLTFAFTAIASLAAVTIDDRARGLGAAIVAWLLAAVVYDGLILLVVTTFGDYPLERPLIVLTLLNPVDLGRVLLLLRFDSAALMGYTGAVFEHFLGTAWGTVIAVGALLLWTGVPCALSLWRFRRKDF